MTEPVARGIERPPSLRHRVGALLACALVALGLTGPHAASAGAVTRARCQLLRATIVGTPRADLLIGTAGHDVIAGRGGSDRIVGRGGDDTICGGAGHDVLRGGAGIDSFDAGAGRDRVFGGDDRINAISYVKSPRPVSVDLGAGEASGWGRDTISGVHQVEGSRFGDRIEGNAWGNALIGYGGEDVLIGADGDDSLVGGHGDDVLAGGRGSDYGVFIDSPEAVDADLRAHTATGEGSDVLSSLENLFGSRHDDVLIGDRGDNAFIGGIGGDDRISGMRGDDVAYRYYGESVVSGGRGSDTVYYEFQGTIDLTSGTAVGPDFSDRIRGFENAAGGSESQAIVGDSLSNALLGGGGIDAIRGEAGDDLVSGGRGGDTLAGGDGRDRIRGGRGDDRCVEGEDVTGCEVTAKRSANQSFFRAMPRSVLPSPPPVVHGRALLGEFLASLGIVRPAIGAGTRYSR